MHFLNLAIASSKWVLKKNKVKLLLLKQISADNRTKMKKSSYGIYCFHIRNNNRKPLRLGLAKMLKLKRKIAALLNWSNLSYLKNLRIAVLIALQTPSRIHLRNHRLRFLR